MARIKVSESDVCDGTLGVCRVCGEIAYGVEPDAEFYECDNCGSAAVFGLEQALLCGIVDIDDESSLTDDGYGE